MIFEKVVRNAKLAALQRPARNPDGSKVLKTTGSSSVLSASTAANVIHYVAIEYSTCLVSCRHLVIASFSWDRFPGREIHPFPSYSASLF